MITDLCNETYTRPQRQGEKTRQVLSCQYIANHPGERHSWSIVETQDEHEQAAAAQRYFAPTDEKELLERIEAGFYDSILEALLNAGHNRKRTLRGVRGFPRLERRTDGRNPY